MSLKQKIQDFLNFFFRNKDYELIPATAGDAASTPKCSRRDLLRKTKAKTVDVVVGEIDELRNEELRLGEQIADLKRPIIEKIRKMNPFFQENSIDTFVAMEPGKDPVENLVNEIFDTILSCYRNFHDDADIAYNLGQYIEATRRVLEKEEDPQRKKLLEDQLRILQSKDPEELLEMEACDPFTGDREYILDRINVPRDNTYEKTMLGFPLIKAYGDYIGDKTSVSPTMPRWKLRSDNNTVPFLDQLISDIAPAALEVMDLERQQKIVQAKKFAKMYSVISTTDRTCILPPELSAQFSDVNAYCTDYVERGMGELVDRLTKSGVRTDNLRAILVNALKNGGQALRSEESIRDVVLPLLDEELANRVTGNSTPFRYHEMSSILTSIGEGMADSKIPQGHRVLYYYDKEKGKYVTVMGKESTINHVPQIRENNEN